MVVGLKQAREGRMVMRMVVELIEASEGTHTEVRPEAESEGLPVPSRHRDPLFRTHARWAGWIGLPGW